MVRVVFFGSSDSVFSNRHFARLAECSCEIAAVVDVPPQKRVSTNASRPEGGSFVQTARSQGIPCFEPVHANDPQFMEEMKKLQPDLFVAVGYMLLLGPRLLSVPRVGAVNFHASLLPAYRGKHPVFWALRHGEPSCGLTVHEMSAGLDTGDIIFQVRVPVRPGDSVSAVYERIMAESVPLVSKLVDCAASGSLPRAPQAADGASYFGATTEADFLIDWSMEPVRIARWVNATPGQCFAMVRTQKLFLMDAAEASARPGAGPGVLQRLDHHACLVTALGGAVEIRKVRRADGPVQDARDVLVSLGCQEGAALGGA
jgi:methionyl-tRNA formyltransferase